MNWRSSSVSRRRPRRRIREQFDDQTVLEATLADIDMDLALTTLKRYSAKLERGDIGAQQLRPLMRELGLLANDNGTERPTLGCVLLFGRDPGRFFPLQHYRGTINEKKRKLFAGNLVQQHKAVLDWFEEEKINPQIKVKGRRQHESRSAYPDRALVELLVNMIVHRDYSVQQPSSINVMPQHAIRFANPCSTFRGCLAPSDARSRRALLSRSRNSANSGIARCATCSSASVRWNAPRTGLTDTRELAEGIGGAATFAYPPSLDSFAELFRLKASAAPTLSHTTIGLSAPMCLTCCLSRRFRPA